METDNEQLNKETVSSQRHWAVMFVFRSVVEQ